MPMVDLKEDWGFHLEDTCETPAKAKEYVRNAMLWLCEIHDIDEDELINTKTDKSVLVRDIWYFVALEALRPWLAKIEISRLLRCRAHATFNNGWTRQIKRHEQERLLWNGPEGPA